MANISNIIVDGVSYSYDKEMVSGLADQDLIMENQTRRFEPQLAGWIMGTEATNFKKKDSINIKVEIEENEPSGAGSTIVSADTAGVGNNGGFDFEDMD